MSKAIHRELFAGLAARGLLEYGSFIPAKAVHEIMGVTVPETAPLKVYKQIELVELGAVDYVRGLLLLDGKYLAGIGEDYRILLPSENRRQVESYIAAADRKLNRALKLSRNMPRVDTDGDPCQLAARVMMKQGDIRGLRDAP